MSYEFLNQLDIDQDVTRRITQSLDRVVEGNLQDYRSPFLKDYSSEEILSKWDKVFQEQQHDLELELDALEQSNRDKFGSRSLAKPWSERRASVDEYFVPQLVRSVLRRRYKSSNRLRPISLESAVKFLKNNTNSGLPYYKRKSLVKNKTLSNFQDLLSRKDPSLLFTRTQEQSKTRNVWGYPIADTLNEMLFYIPLLQLQRQLSWRSALNGPVLVNYGVTDLFRKRSRLDQNLVSIDFSSYDASVKQGLQELSFDYVKSLFQTSYHSNIDYIKSRFGTIGIVTPDGVKEGNHGVPSGSTLTNEIDSIAQWLSSSEVDCEIQGDDGLYSVHDYDRLIDEFKSNGLDVNLDKTFISKRFAVYLQNYYSEKYVENGILTGIYPVYRALNRIVHQERWVDFEDFGMSGQDYYSLRTISILENCRYHPLFKLLVKFIVDNDKYSLEYSDKGIRNYIEMISSTSGSQDLIVNQYGDDLQGFRNFHTVKLIKEL